MQLNCSSSIPQKNGLLAAFTIDIFAEPLFTATDVMYMSVTSRLKVQPWGQSDDVHQYFWSIRSDLKEESPSFPMVMEMGLKGIAIEYIFWGN